MLCIALTYSLYSIWHLPHHLPCGAHPPDTSLYRSRLDGAWVVREIRDCSKIARPRWLLLLWMVYFGLLLKYLLISSKINGAFGIFYCHNIHIGYYQKDMILYMAGCKETRKNLHYQRAKNINRRAKNLTDWGTKQVQPLRKRPRITVVSVKRYFKQQ